MKTPQSSVTKAEPGGPSRKEALEALRLLSHAVTHERNHLASRRRDVEEAPTTTTELRYQTLVEQIPAVVFTAALEGGLREIYVNPQITTLLGYSQEEWQSN